MKKFLFRILCNPYTGKIISIIFNYNVPNIRHSFKRFLTPQYYCNDTVRAMIFFGFYESAEMRLIQKYIPTHLPVIELGSSLGIVSSVANKKINLNTQYKCVEPNPYLKEYIKSNILKYSPKKINFSIIIAAIAYTTLGKIEINISDNNTESSIPKTPKKSNSNFILLDAITLSSLVDEEYTLICDIEGSEIDILKHDSKGLELCKHLFIELHTTTHNNKTYTVSDLEQIINTSLGFKLIERDGNVFYFNKITTNGKY